MQCASCAHTNRDSARFCEHCGQRLTPPADGAPTDPRGYTPRHLAERILTGRAALEGERKQVTVLFADIEDSMPLAERVGPEEWHRVLDRFFVLLNEGVHRFDGTVNQYTGDGIMALFGAPLALEDHAQRACHAALHLRDRLREFGDALRRRRGIALHVRIGINSGEVVVGTIGDDLRMDYTAQGHTVGLAQRVQQVAAPGTACIAQATAALVADEFDLTDRGSFALKGVSEPTRVYALDGLARARGHLDSVRARSAGQLVGRGSELAVLERALDEAAAGHGSVLGVVGEPGIGKTRLCLALAAQCRARGVVLAQAHCPAHAASVPRLPISALLRSLFDLQPSDSAALTRRQLRRALRPLGRGIATALPVACELLELPDPAPQVPLPDAERQERLRTFLRRLVQAQSAAAPLLLFVDDVHCMAAEAEALLGEIVEALGWTRTLLLTTFRPGYEAAWMRAPYYRPLTLAPLSDTASDALLHQLVGDDASTGELRALIRERTGGNPFFIEEVVQSLLEHGALHAGERGVDAAPRLQLVHPVAELSIPPTVQALLAARLDRLAARDKQVVQAASVIGRSFAPAILRHVLTDDSAESRLQPAELDAALAELTRADFVRASADGAEAEYAFKHPLTQAVAYGTQLADGRARLHVAVARALQALHPEQLGQCAALLAHHYAAANWSFEAARWRRRAALRVTKIELGRGRRPARH